MNINDTVIRSEKKDEYREVEHLFCHGTKGPPYRPEHVHENHN